MGIVLAARIVEWGIHVRNYLVHVDFENGQLERAEYLTRLDAARPWLAITSVGMIFQAIAGVLFVVWLYRARGNAAVLSPARHRLSRVWSVIGFLPILNLVIPPIVLDDVQRAVHPDTPVAPVRPRANRTTALVVLWWSLFVVGSLLLAILSLTMATVGTEPADAGRFGGAVLVFLAAVVVIGTAAVLLAILLRRVQRWEAARVPQATRTAI
ncbi:DUF4328 domain-containing protein [Nocardia blacklockiae]|uniref:DUF4328 domain-containing protein n=1 Tax=Nocardia blacklockiae TaxID=480036 RepID=UPI0018943F65|nr:DUF4328 domain-containing protein [Nocardia blacklockiae]MBF6173914.1 DUF4328 domain-containing protein [Nocardia blacklockiae]